MIFKNEGTLYLACNDKKAFSLIQTIEGIIIFSLVRMYVTYYRFSWIISTSDLVISYTENLLVFRRAS